MIIPEDGCLPKITRTGFAAFNNVMIIKVPEKYRKPGETIFQLATLDHSKKGERWPADKYLDGTASVPEVEIADSEVFQKNKSEKNELKNFNCNVNATGRFYPNQYGSEGQKSMLEKNLPLQDNSKSYAERQSLPVTLPEATQVVSNNANIFLPAYNLSFRNHEFPDNHAKQSLGDPSNLGPIYGEKGHFEKSPEEAFKTRMPNRANFHEGFNFKSQNKKAHIGLPRNEFSNFPHQRKYFNPRQEGRFEKRINNQGETASGNKVFKNFTDVREVSGNNFVESNPMNSHNYSVGIPNINCSDGQGSFPPMPEFHCVRPFNYSNDKVASSTHTGSLRDLPNTDLDNFPIWNPPDNRDPVIRNPPFSGFPNGNYNPEPFPFPGYSGGDYNNMYNIRPQFERKPEYMDRWSGVCHPRNGEDPIRRNGFEHRNQTRPWRSGYNKSKNYNRGRRNHRFHNNRYERKNEKTS